MDKDLLAEYGEACIALEIAQNKHADIKRKIAFELSKPKKDNDEKQ